MLYSRRQQIPGQASYPLDNAQMAGAIFNGKGAV